MPFMRSFILAFLLIVLAGSAYAASSGLQVPGPEKQQAESPPNAPAAPLPSAQKTDVYAPQQVSVDETAASGTAARDQALLNGQRKALVQLLSQIGATLDADKLTEPQISSLVQNFEIENEKTSGQRYMATLTVTFKEDRVRAFLSDAGITFSETASKPVLVLPIVITDGRPVLWEEPTPWATAWQKGAKTTGLVPMIVPTGDLKDIGVIGAAEVMSGKRELLTKAAAAYQAAGVIVPVIEIDMDNPDLSEDITVAVNRFGDNGTAAAPFAVTVPKTTAAGLDDLLAAAVRMVHDQLEQSWKQSTKVASGPLARLPIQVQIGGLEDWAALRRRLAKVPNVQKVEILSLTRAQASAQLLFRGTISDLQNSLAQANMTLSETGPAGAWELRANDL